MTLTEENLMNGLIEMPDSVFLVLLVPYLLVYMEGLLIVLYELIVFGLKYCGCLICTMIQKGIEVTYTELDNHPPCY